MLLARRLYLYFISAVSLTTLAIGMTNLLELLFRWTGERFSDTSLLSPDPDEIRRQLSIHVALVIVSLPVWLLHWLLIERSVSFASARREVERRASLRDLYLAVGLAIPFIFWIVNAIRLIERAARSLLGAEEQGWYWSSVESALAIIIVTGAIVAYHAWVRIRDEHVGQQDDSSDWLIHLYLLGAAFTGAMLLLFGLSKLLALVVEIAVGDQTSLLDEKWWVGVVAQATGPIVVGLFAWLLHWGYIQHLARRSDWRGERLRRSSLLYAYVYALALIGVFASLIFIGAALQALLQVLLGGSSSAEPTQQLILEPVARSMPFIAIWMYHRIVLIGEVTHAEQPSGQATLQRIYTYAIALVGLGVGAFGLTSLLDLSLDRVLESGNQIVDSSNAWRHDLSTYLALTAVGTIAWLWHWLRVHQWVEHDPANERITTPRRAYLLTAIAGSVIALVGSLAVVIYRLLAAVLGVEGVGSRSDLSAPVAISLVGAAVLLYHGMILRTDILSRPESEEPKTEFWYVVTAPPEARAEEITASIRAALPPDYEVRRLHE